MEAGVNDVLDAVRRRDWEALQRLLHPYLHWTDSAGVTVRGRRNVIARLMEGCDVSAPRDYETRDGQIYRWREER